MNKQVGRIATLGISVAMMTAVGCASTTDPMPVSEAQRQLEQRERELAAAEKTLRERDQQIETLSSRLHSSELPHVSAPPPGGVASVGSSEDMLPPSAKAGECYARTYQPPVYESRSVERLKTAAAERIEVVPARYEMVEQQVLVKEATQKLEVVPPVFGEVEERVLVEEASFRLEEVPAVFEWKEEQVLVKPAQTVWKKGRGPIEKVDDATGEIMCLVEEPAVYKTVRERVLVTPATTRRVEIPAQYKTVKRRVVTQPGTTRTIEIPAEYKTVKVRKLVEGAKENRIEIPAQYQTVKTRELVRKGQMAWRPVLCETNASRDVVTQIQQALQRAGHSPGPIDGIIGEQTLGAVKSFQQEKQLPTGGLTYATIDALGVTVKR